MPRAPMSLSRSLIVAALFAIGSLAETVAAPAEALPYPPSGQLAPDALKIGVQRAAFPFSFNTGTSTHPVYRGYAVDLCLQIAERWRQRQGRTLNVARDIQWVEVSSRTRLIKLLAGDIDLECGSTSNTASRRALGIVFSPTYYVARVGLMVRPELAAHSDSLMAVVSRLHAIDGVMITTAGTTSVNHLQELVEPVEFESSDAADDPGLTNRRLRARFPSDHSASYAALEQGDAHAFMMDDVLLVAALKTRPGLQAAGIGMVNWSPVPAAQECYGIMSREPARGRPHSADRPLADTIRDVILTLRQPTDASGASALQHLYAKWFQSPLAEADLPPGLPAGIELAMPPSAVLSRLLGSPNGRVADCE